MGGRASLTFERGVWNVGRCGEVTGCTYSTESKVNLLVMRVDADAQSKIDSIGSERGRSRRNHAAWITGLIDSVL